MASTNDFTYEFLSADEQAAAIRDRLVGLERDRFNVALDVSVAGDTGNPTQQARLTQLDACIETLRSTLNDLTKPSK